MMGTTTGKADVYLDDVFAKTVSLSNSTPVYQQNVWSTGALSAGAHKVRISWNTSNAAGKFITLDAVDVHGTLTSAPPAISGLSPNAGSIDGGTSVTITGSDFIGAVFGDLRRDERDQLLSRLRHADNGDSPGA